MAGSDNFQRRRFLKRLAGWTAATAAIVALAVVGKLFFDWRDFKAVNGRELPDFQTQSIEEEIQNLAEDSASPSFGNPKAELVIVEFGDFQCSFCNREFIAIREFVVKHQEEVLLIFRQFPSVDENSISLARAGYCAQEQEKFWQFHDRLFSFFAAGMEFSPELLAAAGKSSGLEPESFARCWQSEKHQDQLEKDYRQAVELGVSGTPTFFINGRKLAGTPTLETWEKIFKEFKSAADRQ